MTLFFIAFIAGVLTVLAPCILPLLPVVVGGSLDNKGGGVSLARAVTVTVSLSVSLIAFTLLLKVSTLLVDIPPDVWKWISGSIIIFFGLVSIFPKLWERLPFVARWNADSNIALGKGFKRKSVWGDVIIGAALGPVFSTCSPTYFVILATVLPVSLALGIVYLAAYVVGLALALLFVAFLGQRLMGKLGIAADPHGPFKRLLGILFLLVGLAILTGYDKRLQLDILNSGFYDVTRIEQRLLESQAMPTAPLSAPVGPATDMPPVDAMDATTSAMMGTTTAKSATERPATRYLSATQKAVLYKKPPELTGIDGYINTDGKPIKLSDYKGKVVLLDIWTYSCINCQRTLPYVTSWYEKYKDKGFVVIGIHTPEFAFEHVQKNVEDATRRFGIHYPVVLDNEYATWNALDNHYWPRKYLIDVDGYIVYDHAGEGAYTEAEEVIQKALMERSARMGTDDTGIATTTSDFGAGTNRWGVGSPETYFGSARNDFLGNGERGESGVQTFTEPLAIDPNTLYLIGKWNVAPEYAETTEDVGSSKVGSDRIDYLFTAKHLYFVAGAKANPVTIEVTLDGKPLDETNKGADVFIKEGRSYVTIGANTLYDIVNAPDYGKHLIEFIVSSPGLQVYTFTFG
jgi:cytochrome c biogenesis protein CcdA/thiol-disulfide isomerase/thioredoxin